MMETEEFEVCVLCGEGTDVRNVTHVENRQWYVRGVGQLCLKCTGTGFTDFGSRLKQLRIQNDE